MKTKNEVYPDGKMRFINLLGPNASLSVGRVIRIFTFESPETSLLGLKGYSHQPNLSMTPEEEAYEEALRPIRKAEETGARELGSQPT